ncbi:putative RNA methyltransferase [Arthrobacter sp. GMC3]|uniref:putative RNA methyltransferase n=1 Tax=Arthrobacter sp. GMC3 TaxID=2058894 RepID=UPI000CE344E6|nr:methyltransferase domain-containing protein [Arthrobacter sp. GMC3]
MENSAVDVLICPVCGLEFMDTLPGENALKCIDGHSFDIARQGYVNLLTGHGTKFAQDTATMVAARDDFLDAGHYGALAEALAEVVGTVLAAGAPGDHSRPLILDAGTGTGYYLNRILATLVDDSPGGSTIDSVGLDISKFALRRASRRNPDTANLVWDLWQPLPVEAARADVVLVIFAPRNAAEFARVLKPRGRLVVVTPRPGHLAQIAQTTGMLGIQEEKEAGLVAGMAGHFQLQESRDVTITLNLSRGDVRNVALMGPAGHHLDPQELAEKVGELPPTTPASAEFLISIFAPIIS